ncbi:Ras-related protein RABA1i [Zostera marina]|uniref:Ras-related protein RABA1i n=1 Tax=Zostera marina TaxID=29655 RepID=A0A0K9PNI4_ZOSMR|nr:Ras-related protein RABA1i [Zostera marina]
MAYILLCFIVFLLLILLVSLFARKQGSNHDHLFKVVMIGDSNVGKSNILSRLTKNKFSHDTKSTVGIEFGTHNMKMDNKKIVKAQIWGSAGKEKAPFYKKAAGVIIVYDITRRDSYENVKRWLTEVKKYASANVVIILVGNKADLHDLRAVTTEEADAFAKKENIFFMETSALKSTNVYDSFNELLKQIYDIFKKNNGAANVVRSKRSIAFI